MDSNSIYIHHINPFLWQISGNFGIRWYGMAYLVGLVLGGWIITQLIQKGRSTLKKEEVSDFVTYVALGMMIGGRLGYVLFYSPDLIFKWTASFPFWGALEVNRGGMASHGGILGIMVGCLLYSRKRKKDLFHLIDLTCYGGALGIFFGRIANFINGELYGREMEKIYSWGVRFPQEMFRWTTDGATFKPQILALQPIVQSLPNLSNLSAQWFSLVEQALQQNSLALAQINHAIGQIFDLSQEGHPQVLEALSKVLLVRHPSQLYEALLEGAFLFIVLTLVALKTKKIGIISGLFGVLYSLVRILGEQFRMPDAQIGFQLFGLTRGQWLSLVMLVFSLFYLISMIRRNRLLNSSLK